MFLIRFVRFCIIMVGVVTFIDFSLGGNILLGAVLMVMFGGISRTLK